MSQVLEGTWEEILRQADRLAGKRVRLTILEERPLPDSTQAGPSGGRIYFGMFPQLGDLTEEDFRAAEFHGDPDDGLDWT